MQNASMWTITCVVVLFLARSSKAEVQLDCLEGWTNIGVQCYKLFKDMVLPWESAVKVCKSYGSELAKIEDFYENQDVGEFAENLGVKKFWIGFSRFVNIGINRISASVANDRIAYWSDGEVTSVAAGFWQNEQPDIASNKCVFVAKDKGRYKWSFGPCEQKNNYVCQRPACPKGSFHCISGRCINPQLKCDGEDDCGDSSDENSCPSRCSYLLKQSTGTIRSKNDSSSYEKGQNCRWIIEVPLGSNAHLKFTAFNTEKYINIVQVLVGGLTESKSMLVKTLSGNLSTNLPEFTSNNNFIMVKFLTDNISMAEGFEASFSEKNANFPVQRPMTSMDSVTQLISPLYPSYLALQDYTWVITAARMTQMITLKVLEIDLKGIDRVLIRDGDMVSDPLLAEYKGEAATEDPPYVFSTGNKMYIVMQTRGYETGKGFKFSFWQGCSATLTSTSGHVFSPGFPVSNYANLLQKCVWKIEVHGDPDLTLRILKFDTQRNVDTVKIYNGTDSSKTLVSTLSGPLDALLPDPVRNKGKFQLEFETDAIIKKSGFSAKYSIDCPNPNFNNNTLLNPVDAKWHYGSDFRVSCKEGYRFAADEFRNPLVKDRYESRSSVRMICRYGGVWNTRRIPDCEPMYCGQAFPVKNGYIEKSTGMSSSYSGSVIYACYPGFTMTGSATVKCLSNGTWDFRPTCDIASCSQSPKLITKGTGKVIEGDGTEFGSIVEYTCETGYHIHGSKLRLCESNSSWSQPLPTCKKKNCLVPTFENAKLDSTVQPLFGDSRVVTCDSGYEMKDGATTQNITCQADQGYKPAVETIKCQDKMECIGSHGCGQKCQNTIGSFYCECGTGYTLHSDKKTCNNINECVKNKGGCSQICNDTDGGYKCSCKPGFVLFTEDGIMNYTIPTPETGKLEKDVLRINHTCVRVQCPDIPNIDNGNVLKRRKYHRFGDYQIFTCNLGYILKGDSVLRCTSTGKWNALPPTCELAKCKADTISPTLLTEPTVSPSGDINYLGYANLTCNVPGKASFMKYRQCLYVQAKNKYELYGAQYECGVIDCGKPTDYPGSKYDGLTTTTFGSNFTFNCKTLYTRKPPSASATVQCKADGYWDFGKLYCEGKTCKDPGRAPDAIQEATSYQEGSEVKYRCIRPGFSIQGTNPIKCVLNIAKDGLKWSAPIPACVDTTKPNFTNCVGPVSVSKYSSAAPFVQIPTPTDNVAVKSFTILPVRPSNSLILTSAETFLFTATDFQGLSETCQVNVNIKDEIPPTLVCPSPKVVFITKEGESQNMTFSKSDVTVADESGEPSVRFSPISFTATDKSINTGMWVTATATDKSGNSRSCRFEVHVRAAPCSPFSLTAPLNGKKTCSEKADKSGYTCDLTCNTKFVFYEQSSSSVVKGTCETNKKWVVPVIPACARTDLENALYIQVFQFEYDAKTAPLQTCKTEYQTLMNNVIKVDVKQHVDKLCSVSADTITVIMSIRDKEKDIIITGQKVFINYTVEYHGGSSCTSFVKVALEGTTHTPTQKLTNKDFSPLSCPSISAHGRVGQEVFNDYSCPSNRKLAKYNSLTVCLHCPPGTYNTGGANCKPCDEGMFNYKTDQKACEPCGIDLWTRGVGATSNAQCLATCLNGTYSSTRLPPCAECPLNTFWKNSTHCDKCPSGYITRITGAKMSADCKAECPLGTYNPIDGHEDCTPCPKNFYQNVTGQTSCWECRGSDITLGTGSVSIDNCISAGARVCPTAYCSNRGNCSVTKHSPICTCDAGYTGEKCENQINFCESDPCFNNGTCIPKLNGYDCKCPNGTSGKDCRIDEEDCKTNPCKNGGMCQNAINDYKCLCLAGFEGTVCTSPKAICDTMGCKNGGTCVPIGNIHRKCQCSEGFTGKDCGINIDDCASNPCLYGGNCTDQISGYKCSCINGYSGDRCEKIPNICNGVTCGSLGQCVPDHITKTYRCICNTGATYGEYCQYSFRINTRRKTKGTVVNKNTMELCRQACDVAKCKDFTFNSSSSTCQTYSTVATESDLETDNAFTYYKRQCFAPEDDFWTPWYNTKSPTTGPSDVENIGNITMFGVEVCKGTVPLAAECQDVKTKNAPTEILSDQCTVQNGLTCVNSQQGDSQCEDYEIRYKCATNQVFVGGLCYVPKYCDSNPCQNGGCSEVTGGFKCSCKPGFTGSLCQNNIDDCAVSPCLNGVTCKDAINDFSCECVKGYKGKRCEINIDDCSPNLCTPNNHIRCEDLVNDYRCHCKPGYTGKKCEVDIDECASNPCFHGGKCKQAVNDFTCECPKDWYGKRCASFRDACTRTTCKNEANCSNLATDYFCRCKPNTYGKECQNASSICKNANPCVHGGLCSETAGSAKCTCGPAGAPDYYGTGCEIAVDHCPAGTCKNGATCKAAMGKYKCECPKGFEGLQCQTNTDNCNGVTCPGIGAKCIDGIDEYFCRCPLGKVGEYCQKNLSSNYDLLFDNPRKTSMAYLPYPLPIDVTGLTVSVWGRFLKDGGKGTFLSIFSVDSPNSLTGKKPLLRIDDEGLYVDFDGKGVKTFKFPYYKYNDSKWFHIVVTWDSKTGTIKFIVNTINRDTLTYAQGVTLKKNIWIVLGAKYDPVKEMAVVDEGFSGYISQVTIYSRPLLFNSEVPLALQKPYEIFPDIIFQWNEYKLSKSVQRIIPSTIVHPQLSCKQGFAGKPCVEIEKKVMVEPTSCPKDIIKYGPTRITMVDWNVPVFSGRAKSDEKTHSSGQTYLWNKFLVIYVAENSIGNKGLCSFKLFVQYDQCTRPASPANGTATFNNEIPHYTTASLQCNKNPDFRTVRPVPSTYTCPRIGSWDPPNKYLSYKVPPCGLVKINPLRQVKIVLRYVVNTQYCDGVDTALEKELRQAFLTLDTAFNGLCQKTNCTDIIIVITCGTGTTRRKRALITKPVKADITIPKTLAEFKDGTETLSPVDVIRRSVLSRGEFDFSRIIPNGKPLPDGFEITAVQTCPSGQALVQGDCVECAPGTFYNSSTETCDDCPIGQYQPLPGQPVCLSCSGTITELPGSETLDECKTICQMGQFFNKTGNKCDKCPYGFYQNTTGLFFCWPCPVDKTTRREGAISSSECYNDCPPGQEISTDGKCVQCPIGKYRGTDDRGCLSCPKNLVTNITGAVSKSQCNVGNCLPGFKRDSVNQTECVACPVGTYQNESQQYSCKSCGGERYTTDSDTSTSEKDCKFFCPDGREKQGTTDTCEECEIGFYRNSSLNRYDPCQPCPGNKRTEKTGSKSDSECTVYKCKAGEKPNAGNTDCVKCPKGFYQPLADQKNCHRCGNMESTRAEGSVNKTQCEKYCQAGYEKDADGKCKICDIGFYKSNVVDMYSICTVCPDTNFVTPTPGSISADNCTIRNCTEGYKIKDDKSGCEMCPKGKYQPKPYKMTCESCTGTKKSTRKPGSKLASDCESYCDSGLEKNPTTSNCDICQRGFYKDNNVDVFSLCTLCPAENITNSTGAKSMDECNIRNCSAGYFTKGNECVKCVIGEYQPLKWKDKCEKCPLDTTTQEEGSTARSDCILSCDPGKEDVGGTCVPCKQGFYKPQKKAAKCTECPANTTTSGMGATNKNECNLAGCLPGYSRTLGNTCEKCDYGYHQSLKWQKNCDKCKTGLTTYKKGAMSDSDCLTDCVAGKQYNTMTKVCDPCPRGYYNDKSNKDSFACIMCNSDMITAGEGSTKSSDCNIKNCTVPGEFRNPINNLCEKCDIGKFQSEKWQDNCTDCPDGFTTKTNGSSSVNSCLRDCPAGQQLNQRLDRCTNCLKGYYREKSVWECQKCPGGLLTGGEKAVSKDECTVSPCLAGSYYDRSATTTNKCKKCERNYYQPKPAQFKCEPCPNGEYTSSEGSTNRTDCQGFCKSNNHNCSQNAVCTENAVTKFTCKCKSDYSGDGYNCTHKCNVNYCLNGKCKRKPRLFCQCDEQYFGDRCDIRKDPSKAGPNSKDIAIYVTIAVIVFLLLIIFIVICICYRARRKAQKRPLYNDYDDRVSIATRLSTKGYSDYPGNAAPSLGGQRLMLPQQLEKTYDNPLYSVSDDDPAIYKA